MSKMNWSKRQWKDVLSIVNGKNQKDVESDEGLYPIIGSGGTIGRAIKYLCEAGSTVVGRKGTINNPFFVDERFWNVDTAFGIQPGKSLIPKFLFYFCKGYNFKKLDKSTTIPSLAKTDLLKIEMPVPSLEEQEKIVNGIEELFSELDSAVETLKKTKEQLAVYRQSVLKDAFSRFSSKEIILNHSELVTSGSRGWAQYYSEQGARFIRITDLTRDRIVLKNDDVQYVALPNNVEGKRSRLMADDILVSITADLGSVALVPENIEEAYINQHIALVRLKNPEVAKFIALYLKSDWGQKDLLRNKRGGGKLGLGLDDIRNTPIPIVSNDVARKVVSQIESRLTVCDNIEKTVNETLAQAEAMRQSILKKAFEGNL